MNKAILVAHKEEDSVNEALELCESAGYKVVHVLQQKYMDRPKFGIGKGGTRETRRDGRKARSGRHHI